MSRYATIVADPAWTMKGGPLAGGVGEGFVFPGKQQTRPLPYATMTLEEIRALPVGKVAAENAALFLWAPNGYVEHVYRVARTWGFTPSTLCVWAKNLMGGGLGGAFGISTEYFLYARKGQPIEKQRIKGTWFNWKRPYNEQGKPRHSAKPPEFFELVESLCEGPYLELFARDRRPGWAAWGNEVGSMSIDIEMELQAAR